MTTKMPLPTTLAGKHVALGPLTAAHVPDLFAALDGDEEVWRWLGGTMPRTEAEMLALVKSLKADEDAGLLTAFAVVSQETGRAVGWTTYLDTPGYPESVEIGWTWYGKSVWRTAVNTECKLLLLTHAFDGLGLDRVQLKTDHLNQRSQDAILRLGAKMEGTLRHQRRRADGSWRNTVYFSILSDEWPDISENLVERLARG